MNIDQDMTILFGVMAALGVTSLLAALPLQRRSPPFFWGLLTVNGVIGVTVIALGLPGFEHLSPVIGRLLGLVVGGLFVLHVVQALASRTRWQREDRVAEIEAERQAIHARREARDTILSRQIAQARRYACYWASMLWAIS